MSDSDTDATKPGVTDPDATDPAVSGANGDGTTAGNDTKGNGTRHEGSQPNDADGQFDSQDMPTTDGQMASGTSEEVIPPRAE